MDPVLSPLLSHPCYNAVQCSGGRSHEEVSWKEEDYGRRIIKKEDRGGRIETNWRELRGDKKK
jgi:hypothetical protein